MDDPKSQLRKSISQVDGSIGALKIGDKFVGDVFSHHFGYPAQSFDEVTDFESYAEYLDACNLTGRAVRFSEAQFNSYKERAKK